MHVTWHSHFILTDMTYWNITDEVIQYEDSPPLASKHYLPTFSLVTSDSQVTLTTLPKAVSVQDLRSLQWCSWNLKSSGVWHCVRWVSSSWHFEWS